MPAVLAILLLFAALLAPPPPITVTIDATRAGDTVTLHVTTTTQQAASVHVEALLPEGTTPLTATIQGGACNAFGCNVLLSAGQTALMTETGTLPGPGTYTFTAIASTPDAWASASQAIGVAYPLTVSLTASDLDRGQTYTATVSAPQGAHVALSGPAWLTIGPIQYEGGDTWHARVSVAQDAPDAADRLVLLVDGVQKDSAGIRVGTPAPKLIYLPLVRN